ncbi:SEFIR domain-containing protein [Nitrosomonas sp. PY1]|uniref:SEFIR domain-containing protein n=1 Tax=Nitrosomonas sp. PY1 TaxID=1803906 RepID=UPI001FC877C9|nr:SEFIR domain-containing protein [Nitrosomonas sp. PY1]
MTKVFISYSHDNAAHQQRVYALADRLKSDGVDIILDRDWDRFGGPDEGWDKWSEMQAEKTEIVLSVFTPEYRKCWDGDQIPGMRLGAIHELKVLYRRLYNAASQINFYRILIFDDDHRNSIPTFLAGLPAFDVHRNYTEILAWLRLKGAAASNQSDINLTWPIIPTEYQWALADRKETFKAFQSMVEQKSPYRILLIQGASNTGKTILLRELFKLAQSINLCSVLLDLKGCPNLNELLDLLALDVDSSVLPSFHSANGSARKLALLKDLENLKTPLLIGFDTYQHIAPDIAEWLEGQFLRRITQCPGLLVLISGQAVPDQVRYPWNDRAELHRLQPIRDIQYWREYVDRVLHNTQITTDHLEMLIHVYQGDPGQTSAVLRSFSGKKEC